MPLLQPPGGTTESLPLAGFADPPGEPAGGGGDVVRWELIPARYGSGSWLVAIGGDELWIWAPPGVALAGAPQEPVERWTRARTPGTLDDIPPEAVTELTLERVIADVPADYERWALDCTADQIRILGLYVRTRTDQDDGRADEHVTAARAVREELVGELERWARPAPPPAQVRPRPDEYGEQQSLFKALSEYEFVQIAVQLLTTQLAGVRRCEHRPDRGCDLFFERPGGERHVVQVKHVASRDDSLVEDAEREAHRLRVDRAAPDVYWYVTSDPVVGRVRRDLIHAVAPWAGERTRVADGAYLESLLDGQPHLVPERVKLRWAKAARDGLLDPRDAGAARDLVQRFTETGAVAVAREALHDFRVVVLHGPPGIGKSTMAMALAGDAASSGYEIVKASGPDDAARALDTRESHVVVWDDVQDAHAVPAVVERALRSDGPLLIAAAPSRPAGVPDELRLEVRGYPRRERALMLYNHLWHRGPGALREPPLMPDPSFCRALVDHPHFTPRMAAFVARCDALQLEAFRTYVEAAPAPEADPELDCLFDRLGTVAPHRLF